MACLAFAIRGCLSPKQVWSISANENVSTLLVVAYILNYYGRYYSALIV